MPETLSVTDAQQTLVEVVERAASQGVRTLICREGQPVAAVVSVAELEELDRLKAQQRLPNLAAVAGQWEGFSEIEGHVLDAYSSRSRDGDRQISLD
jgi:prevent-host-death family protein